MMVSNRRLRDEDPQLAGVMAVTSKMEAIARFARLPLKVPVSKVILQALLDDPEFVNRITFVANREFLANTMVVSEQGSDRVGFELELGACQREEVSIVNGRLVRQVHRSSSLRLHDPLEALQALREFRSRLYVMFCFAGEPPAWYRAVVEPNPALAPQSEAKESVDQLLDEIIREQIDLALLAIVLHEEIDQALARRDEAAFSRRVALYREVVNRCLWEF
ncbi:MAG: YpiB family protein [Firmicutes bacterium]|nr:YpiB family protein [Bacillota bacterium]